MLVRSRTCTAMFILEDDIAGLKNDMADMVCPWNNYLMGLEKGRFVG